eukprot:Em0024g453a
MLNCDLAPTHAVVSFESDGTTSVVPFKNIVGGYSSSVKAGGVCEVQWNDKKKYAATVLAVGSSKEMTTVLDDHDYSDEPPSSDEAMLEVPGTKNLSGSESSPASVVKGKSKHIEQKKKQLEDEPDTADDISDDYCVVKGTKLDCSSSEEVPFEKRRKTSELSDCSTSTDDCTTYQHNAMTVLTQTVSKQLQEMNNNIKSLITQMQQQHNMPSDSHDEWVKSDGFWLGDPNAHLKSGKKLWITSDQKEIANGNCTPTVSNRPLLNQAFVHGIRFSVFFPSAIDFIINIFFTSAIVFPRTIVFSSTIIFNVITIAIAFTSASAPANIAFTKAIVHSNVTVVTDTQRLVI